MSDKELNVKIVADVSQYKRDMTDAKQATENFGDSSKQTATDVERLEATIKDQQSKLKSLQAEYKELVTQQGKSGTAVKELESQMKLLNAQLTLNEQKLNAAKAAGTAYNSSLDGSAGLSATNSAASDLQDTLAQIGSLQMVDAFASMITAMAASREYFDAFKQNIADVKTNLGQVGSAVKQAFGELAGAFNFKNFDVGEDGVKGVFQSMKIQAQEAGTSMRNALSKVGDSVKNLKTAFSNLGQSIKAVFQSSAAKIALLIAAVATLIATIKNAINTAQQLKTDIYDAQMIGMTVQSYREWGYVLENVGVGVDKLSDFLKTLADEQNAVRDGDEDIIKAFEDLGIAANEAASMTQEQLFTETVKGLQQIDDEVRRTSISYRIFGEDAAYLTNVLNLTNAEMDQMIENYYLLGGGVSDSAVQKSLQLTTALNNLKTAWSGLTSTIGELVIPVISQVVQWLAKAIAIVNMFVRTLFGLDIVSSDSGSGIENATVSVGGYTEAVGAATAAAQELKRTTQGFDELNIVSNPNTNAGSSGGTGGGGGVSGGGGGGFNTEDLGISTEDLGLDKWREKIQSWKDELEVIRPAAFVAVGLIGGVLAALSGNWVLAIGLFALAGEGLDEMTEHEGGIQGYIDDFTTSCDGMLVAATVAVASAGAVIAILTGNVPAAIACIATAALAVTLASDDNFQQYIDGFAGDVINITLWAVVAIGVVGGLICLLTGNVPMAIALFAAAGLAIWGLGAVNGWWESITKWILDIFIDMGEIIKNVWNKIIELISSFPQWAKDLFHSAVERIKEVWGTIVGWFSDIWGKAKNVFTNAPQWFKEKFKAAIDAIKLVWSIIKAWFAEKRDEIYAVFSNIGTWFKDKFKSAVDSVKKVFEPIVTFFSSIWTRIKNIFGKVGEVVGSAISDTVKGAINWILDKAVGLINGFIKGINWAIGVINKIPGVEIDKITLLEVPQLAKGGITTGATLAEIGERGREAVLPLENNTGWMDLLADRIAARNQAPSKIILNVDGRELGWASINNINDITKQTGGLQLHIV